MLCRHWSRNKSGFCIAPSCSETPGTLEHLLVSCPALSPTRERLYQMWLERSVMFPTLHAIIRALLKSPAPIIIQFILEPLAFKLILSDFKTLGDQFAHQLAYMTRTFAFYIHREHQKLLKLYNTPTPKVNNQIANISYFPAVATRCDVTTPAEYEYDQDQQVCAATPRPALQPAPCLRGAPPSTSPTSSKLCTTLSLQTTHVQYSASDSISAAKYCDSPNCINLPLPSPSCSPRP